MASSSAGILLLLKTLVLGLMEMPPPTHGVISTPNEEYVVSVATFVGDREGDYVLSNKVTDFITLSESSLNMITVICSQT